MKTRLYLFLSFLPSLSAFSQGDFTEQFAPVRQELVKWDPVRGEWLAQSMTAMARNERTPDRMFPEDFTPSEMFASLPPATRSEISRVSSSRNGAEWNRVNSFVNRAGCAPVQARSYGDPHLSSFDGASYSFQTVGEFLLVKSASDNMEIQVRQRPQRDDFSLNTATAMMVAGDRVAFYANELPDANSSTRIRLNGEALYMDQPSYYLPHGGVIRQESKNIYRVVWPSGESAKVHMHSGSMGYLDLTVEVFPCADQYTGVLGNANGRRDDDFETRGAGSRPADWTFHDFGSSRISDEMEKEHLAWLARDFAASWRITNEVTLFDYNYNENTLTYTDYSFPRVHHTLNDMAAVDRERARRECEAAGVTGSDLAGCIYDGGYLNIPPSPRPPVTNPNPGRTLNPVRKPVPNVNAGGNVTSDPTPAIRREKPAPTTSTTAVSASKPLVVSGESTTPVVSPEAVSTTRNPIGTSSPGVEPTPVKPVEAAPAVSPAKKEPVKPASVPSLPVGNSKPAPVPTTTPAVRTDVNIKKPSTPTTKPSSTVPTTKPIGSPATIRKP